MADNSSSSSSSSLSSSSTGSEESPLALQEAIEQNILSAANIQSYKMGDSTVNRANILESMKAREMLIAERNMNSGTNPIVARCDLRGNF